MEIRVVLVSPRSPLPTPGRPQSRRETPPPAFRTSHFMQLLCLCPPSLSPVLPRRQPQAGTEPCPESCGSWGCPRGGEAQIPGPRMEGWQGQAGSWQQALWHLAVPAKYGLCPPGEPGSSSPSFVVLRSNQPFWACLY